MMVWSFIKKLVAGYRRWYTYRTNASVRFDDTSITRRNPFEWKSTHSIPWNDVVEIEAGYYQSLPFDAIWVSFVNAHDGYLAVSEWDLDFHRLEEAMRSRYPEVSGKWMYDLQHGSQNPIVLWRKENDDQIPVSSA